MNRHLYLSLFLLLIANCLLPVDSFSQKQPAYVSGKVVDENEKPVANVNVTILGRQTVVTTNDSGYFKIKVPADKAFALVFTYSGKKTEQRNFLLNENEQETITVRLEPGAKA